MGCESLLELSDVARDHARYPRNQGRLEKFDGHARVTGPCGDTMEFWLAIENHTIQKIAFITDGCGPSLAAGSMATCISSGKRVEEAASLNQKDLLEALHGLPAQYEHCALLAANTLQSACNDWLQNRSKEGGGQSELNACDACAGQASTAKQPAADESQEEFQERRQIQARLCRIKHKIVVLSGKGGVGKSTIAVNLATALMLSGKRVGLLDADIHGPSIPTMLGLEGEMLQTGDEGMIPVELGDMKVISLGFLLQNQDEAVIWRGPMKMVVIKQFLSEVAWGDLDYLIVDLPPGTGDEPLSVCQLIGTLDGAVVVTTPQKVAAVDVRKSVTFCQRLHVPVLGVVENMSGFVCPKCREITLIFNSGGGAKIAKDMQVPYLGSIPMDCKIAEACDSGRAFIHYYSDSPTAEIMRNSIQPIVELDGEKNTGGLIHENCDSFGGG